MTPGPLLSNAYGATSNAFHSIDPVGSNSHGRTNTIMKGLILAQNERWRRGLGMQVERIPVAIPGEVAKGAVRHGQPAPESGIAILTDG